MVLNAKPYLTSSLEYRVHARIGMEGGLICTAKLFQVLKRHLPFRGVERHTVGLLTLKKEVFRSFPNFRFDVVYLITQKLLPFVCDRCGFDHRCRRGPCLNRLLGLCLLRAALSDLRDKSWIPHPPRRNTLDV